MKLHLLILLFYLFFNRYQSLKNGVYNIMIDDLYLSYKSKNKTKLFLYKYSDYPITFFKIIKLSNHFESTFYYIEQILFPLRLSYIGNEELSFNNQNNFSQLWNFILIDDNNYVIKNYNNCFIKINNLSVFCENITRHEATKFKLFKIYFESIEKNQTTNLEILDKEPIDILIKYIDLRDPNLNRIGIHQIQKDYDNEELRYSIRSILNNIPWINKIFILMPNDKVRYFKEYNFIKEKIIYVKDKDLLGYESSNSFAFQYRYWKMKKFGISDNIIIMDDDYFINNILKKSDFFHVKNGKVLPNIVTSHFIKINKKLVLKNYELYKKKAKSSKQEQNSDIFNYSKYLTFLFILNLFNIPQDKSIYIPKFTHNAIPINLQDVKEVYEIVYKSIYRYSTLDCLYRHYEYLQFQILLVSYTFLKYERTIKDITFKIIELNNSISETYDTSLFCINKIPGNYSYLNLYKETITMEYLFHNPSKYEIIDYSLLHSQINDTSYTDKLIKFYENQYSIKIKKFFLNIFIFVFVFLICIKIIYKIIKIFKK